MSTVIEEQKIIRAKLAKETFNEVIGKLKSVKKCMLIRPTGFGKTYLLAHLTKNFKRVLYLYPIDIIRLDVVTRYKKDINSNTHFMTYIKLLNLYKADKKHMITIANTYDLIICDEAHMAGAELTSEALRELIRVAKETNFIGATATPDRSDGFNVTSELFSNATISEYTLHDAITDGLIPKPHYVYSIYKAAESLKELTDELEKCKNQNKAKTLKDEIKAMEVEMGNLINAPKVIEETVTVVRGKLDYMKFIVFFSEKITLQIKKGEIQEWFKQAYPNMKIRSLIITSDRAYANNIEKLTSMTHESGTIDLIYCIDMLNMGYHIEDLTGIVMLRGTSSNIIYNQQIGRCLSAASDITPIVFDFVNNIFRKPYFGRLVFEGGINKNELEARGSRVNALSIKDLIIDDKIASYRMFINKAVCKVGQLKIDDLVRQYTEDSKPMKLLVYDSKLREEYIRSEFTKRGVVMDD